MHACPACAAPLDNEGICTSCGALSRGFFRGLDLGAPQIADAVAHGLDFYRLLEVAPTAEIRAVARRYRQLRVLFPDEPSHLGPEPARRLALLELAGRVLTDPRLRQMYDQLRAGDVGGVHSKVVRCLACAAPLAPGAPRCEFCGTLRPVEHAPPSAPPTDAGPPPTEPVDYYALLGLTPQHLSPGTTEAGSQTWNNNALFDLLTAAEPRETSRQPAVLRSGPPTPLVVDDAALAREREILLSPALSPEERQARLTECEIARRILRNDQRRGTYDALLRGFRQGQLDGGRLDALRHLQDQARKEIAEDRGDPLSESEAAELLRQGLGYLKAGLPRDAAGVLRRAVAVLTKSSEAHTAYVQALLASDDPLALGGHALRQMLRSIETAEALGAPVANAPALVALCRGLLARDLGDTAEAEAQLRQAVQLDSQLAPAWRGLAALALSRGAYEPALDYCRRALAIDRRDERALLMAAAACLRAGRRDQAREAAAQVAAVRGEGVTAEMVLREISG